MDRRAFLGLAAKTAGVAAGLAIAGPFCTLDDKPKQIVVPGKPIFEPILTKQTIFRQYGEPGRGKRITEVATLPPGANTMSIDNITGNGPFTVTYQIVGTDIKLVESFNATKDITQTKINAMGRALSA